jgi:hypothetical protein
MHTRDLQNQEISQHLKKSNCSENALFHDIIIIIIINVIIIITITIVIIVITTIFIYAAK